MTELNLTLVLEDSNISEDIKKAIRMLKGVVSISENTKPSAEEIQRKQQLADKLCGSVQLDKKAIEEDDKLKYILSK